MGNSNDETFNEQRRKLRRREGPMRILPFVLKRRQFPIQPAFAMTINKAQGQTLNYVGVYLSTPVFSHGQLYVACSRTTARQNLKILIRGRHAEAGYTRNIVYPEVLQ